MDLSSNHEYVGSCLRQALKLLDKQAIQNWLSTNHPNLKISASRIILNEVNWIKEFV
jgi:hypothetical protein